MLNLREGLTFPADYMLEKRLSESESSEAWVATHTQTGDRVFIRFFSESKTTDIWHSIKDSATNLRGLVHQNLCPTREVGQQDQIGFLITPFIAGAQSARLDADNAWPMLRDVIDAVSYAHRLGIAHGNLHPGNLLIDSTGDVIITGFGIPPGLTGNQQATTFLSPEVQSGATPDLTDDIFSIGAMIFGCLTGRQWTQGVAIDTPLPTGLDQLLPRMLSTASFDRQVELETVRDLLQQHYESSSTAIESTSFSRASGSSGQPTTSPSQAVSASAPRANQTDAVIVPAARQPAGLPLQWVLIGGAVLFILAVLLFVLLPNPDEAGSTRESVPPAVTPAATNSAAAAPENQPTVATSGPTPLESARLELMEQQGESLARDIVRRQLDLEDSGVLLWAAEQYAAIGKTLEVADNAYRDRQFEQALTQYKAVLLELDSLIDSTTRVLAEQRALGELALKDGGPNQALTAFTIAVAISPEDATLRKLLQRAENLETVMTLVNQADAEERNGNPDQALALLNEALTLDRAWAPAKTALARVNEDIRRRNFQSAMSRGFRALSSKDYAAATAGFRDAESIMPGSREPGDGLSQVRQAKMSDAINLHQQAAEAFMTNEAWVDAVAEFEAALAITGTLAFAQTGLAEANRRINLEQSIDQFLNDPPLLQSDDELTKARNALREASRISPPSAKLAPKIDTLARLISAARIAVPVTITSDGKTEITVRRHARLGTLDTAVVELIPGRWAIVGSRPGYRDVRQDLVIIPGRPADAVNITSTERVR